MVLGQLVQSPSLPQSPEGNLACHKPIHSGALCFILIVLDKTLLVESDRIPTQTSISKKRELIAIHNSNAIY